LKRKFLNNLFLLVVLNLLIKPLWIFGIDRSVQNLIGSNEYGIYFSLLNFSLLFNIVLDFGITNFNNRNLSQDNSLFKSYFSHIVVIRFLLAILYGCVSISAAVMLGYGNRQIYLIGILLFNQFLASFLLYLRSNISGLQFYTTDSMLSVLDRTLMIIFCSLALWGHLWHTLFKIEYFAYIQTLSYFIACIVVLCILLSKSGKISFNFQRKHALHVIKQSLPFAFLVFLMSFYNRIDSVLLERLLPNGAMHSGIYAQSYRILDAASNFAVLFAALLLPMFSRMLALKEDIKPLMRISFSLLFVLSIAFSISCSMFSHQIMANLYHDGNAYSGNIFSILVYCFIPISISYVFGTLLTANGNLWYLNFTAMIGFIVNIALNLSLIPTHGATGAATASLITQSGVMLGQLIICYKIWNFKVNSKEIVRYVLFIGLSLGSVWFISSLRGAWLLHFVSTLALISLIALSTGILPIKSFIKSIKLQLSRINS
jgi:O-antigen/teichoic acid export membrane protein